MQIRSLGWEDSLEEEMATHSSILAWKIAWTEKPGWLQSMGSQRVGHNWPTHRPWAAILFSRESSWPKNQTEVSCVAGVFFTTEPPGKYYQIYMLSYLCKWGWKVKVKVKSLSPVRLFVTPWTVVYQAPLSTGFSRQEYWSGLPFPSPGGLPDPGIEPGSPTL